MASFKALIVMAIWTGIVGYGLYSVGAHQSENYTQPLWAIAIGTGLLVTHIVNMAIYFKVAGERPFEWIK
jgi:hypothetical protein